MLKNLLTEAIIYSTNDENLLFSKLTTLKNDFRKQNINISINILDVNEISQGNNFIKDKNINLELYLFKNIFWIFAEDFEEYSILLLKIELNMKNLISKINITNKTFIDSIFKNGLSDNLLEISIDGDDLIEFEEDTLVGSSINKTFEYKNIINFEDIQIKYLKLQPLKLNVVLTFRRPNIVNFSDYIIKNMLIDLIKSVSQFIYETNNKIIYIKGENT